MAPDDQDANPVHEGDQQQLGEHGIAQPQRRRDGGLEPGHGLVGDQVPLDELLKQRVHAPVDHQLGDDKQRHRDQEADVNFGVQQERQARTCAHQLTFDRRQHQQR